MRDRNTALRLLIEVVFILVGLFLLWVALTGRYLFDPRRTSWLVLSAALILWGFRRWWGAGRGTIAPKSRAITRIGAASLFLAGLLMLSLVWAPLGWVHWLMMAPGGVLVLRGLAAAALVALP